MALDSTWTVVVASLGSAALTGAASLGVIAYQQHKIGQRADHTARQATYQMFLARCWGFTHRVQLLGEMARMRSGLIEGLDILLRLRKPLDLLYVHDWLNQDWAGLMDSYSDIWAHGEQDVVSAANTVVNRCQELMSAAQPQPSSLRPLQTTLTGVRWTHQERADVAKALRAVGAARREFADVARCRLGRDAVNLWDMPGGSKRGMSTHASLGSEE